MKRSAYWDVKAYDISAAQRLAEALQVSPAITGIDVYKRQMYDEENRMLATMQATMMNKGKIEGVPREW